jgi:hypothetical protein
MYYLKTERASYFLMYKVAGFYGRYYFDPSEIEIGQKTCTKLLLF